MTHDGLIYTVYTFIMEYFRKSVRKSHDVSRASIKRHRNILNAIASKNIQKLEEEIDGMGREWRENIEKFESMIDEIKVGLAGLICWVNMLGFAVALPSLR